MKVEIEIDAPEEPKGDTSEPMTTTTGSEKEEAGINIKPKTRSASKNKEATDKKDIGKSPRRSARTRSQKRQAD